MQAGDNQDRQFRTKDETQNSNGGARQHVTPERSNAGRVEFTNKYGAQACDRRREDHENECANDRRYDSHVGIVESKGRAQIPLDYQSKRANKAGSESACENAKRFCQERDHAPGSAGLPFRTKRRSQ